MSRELPAERNRRLTRLRYSMERDRVLRLNRRYYRKNRTAIRAKQAEHRARHPFVSTPGRRAYMRAYMREWRQR